MRLNVYNSDAFGSNFDCCGLVADIVLLVCQAHWERHPVQQKRWGGHYQEEHSTIGQTSVDGFAHGADILVGNEVELGDFP